MIKVGFVDSWVDEWHAKLYPEYFREAVKKYEIDAEISLVWAERDLEGGEVTTDMYCELHHIKKAASLEELIERVDAIFVLSPDDSRTHEALCRLPLMSGKPVYVDKTFGQDVETAKRMFKLAQEHNTPVFSSSAQRYCQSIIEFNKAEDRYIPKYCGTTGPGSLSNYSVHQLEMLNAVMGRGIRRIKAFSVGEVRHAILEYESGRIATFTQSPTSEFNLVISDGEKGGTLSCKDYYINFMGVVLAFYRDGVVPVSQEDTMEIISTIDTIKLALENQDNWVDMIR